MSMIFYDTMRHIGTEMQKKTGALVIDKETITSPHILDMCCAPGGFLTTSMDINPGAQALGFSLPASEGGHEMRFPPPPNLELRFLDLTMLAADMGVTEIPTEHPDAENFLPRQFSPEKLFSLVICDGQVLRPNVHKRATYRQNREARRLIVTQLALGLEHLQPGGTMVVLLHKIEMSYTMCCVYKFTKFSSVQLFKPVKHHAKRSSFYMVATNVQSRHPEAVLAIQFWKEQWKLATFGSDEEYEEDVLEHWADSEKVIGVFGEELVKLGSEVWNIQAKALSKAPFIKNQIASTGT